MPNFDGDRSSDDAEVFHLLIITYGKVLSDTENPNKGEGQEERRAEIEFAIPLPNHLKLAVLPENNPERSKLIEAWIRRHCMLQQATDVKYTNDWFCVYCGARPLVLSSLSCTHLLACRQTCYR